jgi:hypothetical protein
MGFQRFDEGTQPIKSKDLKKNVFVIEQSAKDMSSNYSMNFEIKTPVSLIPYHLLKILAISL